MRLRIVIAATLWALTGVAQNIGDVVCDGDLCFEGILGRNAVVCDPKTGECFEGVLGRKAASPGGGGGNVKNVRGAGKAPRELICVGPDKCWFDGDDVICSGDECFEGGFLDVSRGARRSPTPPVVYQETPGVGCKDTEEISGRASCDSDAACVTNARKACDADAGCHGIMWSTKRKRAPLKLCRSQEFEKADGKEWRTMLKIAKVPAPESEDSEDGSPLEVVQGFLGNLGMVYTLEALENMKFLNLKGKGLESIPAAIGGLPALEILELSDNKLTEIPAELAELSKLRVLRVSDNKLTTLPAEVGDMTTLTTIYAGGNEFERLPDLSRLDSLKKLYLNEVPSLTCLPAVKEGAEWETDGAFRVDDPELDTCPELCVTVDFGVEDAMVGETCTFPFTFMGDVYYGCADIGDQYGEFGWCALDAEYIEDRWGACPENHETACRAEEELPACECIDKWRSPDDEGCEDWISGCPNAACDGEENTWCLTAESPCKNEEEDGGWFYCEAEAECVDDEKALGEIMGDAEYTCAKAMDDYPDGICDNKLFIPYCCATCAEDTDKVWTLKDGCEEERCSDPARTESQEDAHACCEFFALDQSVKTKAIVADKAGWNTLSDASWAEKLAFVLGEGEEEVDFCAQGCKTYFDGCNNCRCILGRAMCTRKACVGEKQPAKCLDEELPACECLSKWTYPEDEGCEAEQSGCPDAPCDDDENSWCLTANHPCKNEEKSDGGGWFYCAAGAEDEKADCEMEGMCCPDQFTCDKDKKACVAENGAEISAIKCENPCRGDIASMDQKCGRAKDEAECLEMTASFLSKKKICKWTAQEAACKTEAAACASSDECCGGDMGEMGVCFDYSFMKGCTTCASHNVEEDCTSDQNGGQCVWQGEKCHFKDAAEAACKKEAAKCEESDECCDGESGETGVCFDFGFMKGCSFCASHGNGDDCTSDLNGGQCVWQDDKCHFKDAEPEEDSACKTEAATCEESEECCDGEGGEMGICFDYDYAKGCTTCASHGIEEDCLSKQNDDQCFWRDGVCHFKDEAKMWTLKDGCTEERCSDPGRTASQEDAHSCCEFFALDQQVKTKAIIANKAVWNTLSEATWAEKLAFVLNREEEKPKCTCSGDNSGIPDKQKKFANTNYGKSCGAWDLDHRYCSNKRSLAKENRACWCPQEWCYVDKDCATAKASAFFPGAGLYYSYSACDSKGDECFVDGEDLTDIVEEEEETVEEGTQAQFFFHAFDDTEIYVADASDYPYCTVAGCSDFSRKDANGESVKEVISAGISKQSETQRVEDESLCALKMKRDGNRVTHYLTLSESDRLKMAVVTCFSSFDNEDRADLLGLFGFDAKRRRLAGDGTGAREELERGEFLDMLGRFGFGDLQRQLTQEGARRRLAKREQEA